jgi:plasmid stabilization system protein ParE
MARYALSFAPRALAEVATIVRWWRRNRPAAPRLFDDELDAALVAIADHPEIGPNARLRGHPSGRFYVLQRTGYVVFYLVDIPGGEVTVVRIRHVRRRPLARGRRR